VPASAAWAQQGIMRSSSAGWVKEDLVQAVEDLARRTRRTLAFDGLTAMSNVSCDAHSRTNGVMVGLPE